jgi:hypothetical protein
VFHLLPVDSSVGGTKHCGHLGKSDIVRVAFEGGKYNLWLRDMWSGDIFSMICLPGELNDLANKTAGLLPGAVR